MISFINMCATFLYVLIFDDYTYTISKICADFEDAFKIQATNQKRHA